MTVVIVYDDQFTYGKLLKAANYLIDPNCLFIATCMDVLIPNRDCVVPGISPIIHAIELCSNRTAINMGKPNATIVDPLRLKNINSQRTLMIGDSVATDIHLDRN